ncbi:MAG: TonB-dependent receptor, partial [Bryobacterales bacterium]|nr:TonB-dependent receptor [Bryobacterales bacterium]
NLVRSLSSSDRPHVLNVNFIYELPFLKNRRDVVSFVAGGWQVSGFATYRSGAPLSITDTVDTAGVGPGSGNQPWDLVGDPSVSGERGLDRPWFNGAAFARPALGRFGNAGLNILRGPGFSNLDLALFKNFRVRENGLNIQFRAETFNTVNHPVLSNPNINPRGGFFGVVTGKSGERNLQLALKVSF